MIFVDRSRVQIPDNRLFLRAKMAQGKLESRLASQSRKHREQLRVSFDSSIWVQMMIGINDHEYARFSVSSRFKECKTLLHILSKYH
jgi:hypothetical protein